MQTVVQDAHPIGSGKGVGDAQSMAPYYLLFLFLLDVVKRKKLWKISPD